jgi:ParB family chromosome partitioning protein
MKKPSYHWLPTSKPRGSLHPIHVRWSEETERWVIVSGERRWRAARHAGLATVDCFFHEQPLSNGQVLELQLIENLMREDLRPMEEARAFQSLMDLNNWNGKQIAEALQIPASKVSRSLALLDLPAEYQQQVDTGRDCRPNCLRTVSTCE